MPCPLCCNTHIKAYCKHDGVQFLSCPSCELVFKDLSHLPSLEKEKERYLLHENDVEDKNYQRFVAPIVSSILDSHPKKARGLDFGAGSGPVIAKLLRDKNYSINLYDPFFYPDTTVLASTYDFIVCCEVMEHFHNPSQEFELLQKLLLPGGKLYCMTELLPKQEFFEAWYYKNDPTHVIFYSEKNLNWIKNHIGFTDITIDGRLILFTK
jgi:SAM-dependent methyltransferase